MLLCLYSSIEFVIRKQEKFSIRVGTVIFVSSALQLLAAKLHNCNQLFTVATVYAERVKANSD